MSVAAKQLQAADGELRIILPGSWIRIPLRDEVETTAFVKRVLKRRVGTADRLARTRRQVMEEIVGTAREAVKLGFHTYFMSMEILPGVPMPAALLMIDADWPETALPVLREKGAEEALAVGFPGVEVADGRQGPIARRYEMERQQLGEDGSEILTMRLEYFLPYPYEGVEKVLIVRANVPDIPHAEPFALLFNEIADSIVFPALAEAEEAEEVRSELVAESATS